MDPSDAPPSSPLSDPARAAAHFAQRPDAELLYLAQNAARYPPAVGAAAVQELQRRGLVPDGAPARPAIPTPPAAPEAAETWPQLFGQLVRSLLPSRAFWATPLLLALNGLLFLLMITVGGVSPTEPAGHDLVVWGSNVSSLTLPGQPWRLLSSQFVHAGTLHLLVNMLSLWLLGLLIEPRIGPGRLLLGYLACGVGGALASLWYHRQGINSVGASGAIFGLYGVQLVLLLGRAVPLNKSDRRAMLALVTYLVLSNLLSGLSGAIDNAAHIGGLLTGLLLAGPLALIGLRKADVT
ncbi:rhomboid family intramembrane serine protease [uncultured Hymenobacter sp.]|uniref:rhomboid family intramembrane serine protease n=1 Tax=uncultured Hymenobacter sp. TaxID=170016 RepID=UPI0035CAE85E